MVAFRAAIMGLLALVVLLSPALAEVDADDENEESKDASHGFGTDIDWVQWDEAITTAIAADKPIMLMIHKTWCGACKQLKKSFAESNKRKELVNLSQKFVMSNTEDDEEPEDAIYAPDGGYIPRILFLDKYGDPLGVNNKKNFPTNAYYYPQVPDVIRGMKEALKVVKKGEKISTDKKPKDAETKAKESEKDKEAEEGSPPAKPEKIEKPAKKPKEDAKTEKEADKKVKKQTTESGENKADKKVEGGCPHAAAAKKAAAAKEKSEKDSKGVDEKSKPSQSKKKEDDEEKGKGADGATKKSKSSEEKKKKTEL